MLLQLHSMRCFLTLCFLFSISATNVFADDDKLFQIELLFFEHTDPKRFDVELWSKYVGELNFEHAIKLDYDSDMLVKGDSEEFILSREIDVIKQSNSHRFIGHNAWKQELVFGRRSKPIYFEVNNKTTLQGLISVKNNGKLNHVDIDILASVDSTHKGVFRITRNIRVKSKEAYYIDHPVIGIFMVIRSIGGI